MNAIRISYTASWRMRGGTRHSLEHQSVSFVTGEAPPRFPHDINTQNWRHNDTYSGKIHPRVTSVNRGRSGHSVLSFRDLGFS